MREDNECYPSRYLVAKVLVQKLFIDTSLRNEHELPARKLTDKAQMIVDAVHPHVAWTVDDCITWLEGLGEWTKNNRQCELHHAQKAKRRSRSRSRSRSSKGREISHWHLNLTQKNRPSHLLFTLAGSAHFQNQSVNGELLVQFLSEEDTQSFSFWLERTQHDLAHREVYRSERNYIKQGLKALLKGRFARNMAYTQHAKSVVGQGGQGRAGRRTRLFF